MFLGHGTLLFNAPLENAEIDLHTGYQADVLSDTDIFPAAVRHRHLPGLRGEVFQSQLFGIIWMGRHLGNCPVCFLCLEPGNLAGPQA